MRRQGYTLIETMAFVVMSGCIFGAIVQFAGLCFTGVHRSSWRVADLERSFNVMYAWRDELSQVSLDDARVDGRGFAAAGMRTRVDAGFLCFVRDSGERRVRLPRDASLTYDLEVSSGNTYGVLRLQWVDRYATRVETNTVRLVAAGVTQ